MKINNKTIKFMRGDEYSCIVSFNSTVDSCTFHDVVVPANTPQEVTERFLEDAHQAMLNQIERDEYEEIYTTGGAYDNLSE